MKSFATKDALTTLLAVAFVSTSSFAIAQNPAQKSAGKNDFDRPLDYGRTKDTPQCIRII